MEWLRLWHEMPTDPKWRTIARVSGQRIGDVISVYLHLLVSASNASERGRTQTNAAEDIASALDVNEDQVAAILDAMQGRVLDGDMLTGWEKRQPKREDNASERAKEWRERKRTQANASERPEKIRLEQIREEKKEESSSVSPKSGSTSTHGSRFSFETIPPEWEAWTLTEFHWEIHQVSSVFANFRDYWIAQAGAKGRKADWLATWRNWCRKEDADLKKALTRSNGSASSLFPVRESATERAIRVGTERVLREGRL